MDADQVLAFRLARSGLAARDARDLAAAAASPASDFVRDSALIAVAARAEGVTRNGYLAAVESGDLVLAHIMRGAIHALAPDDFALYGRALVARNDAELPAQMGQQVQRLTAEHGISPSSALEEVSSATADALAGGRRLGKHDLHDEWRQRVRPELMPWCKGCGSHHVAPMLWRFATVKAGVRFDSSRRYMLGTPGRAPAAAEAVRRFLGFYGPGTSSEFAEWAGLGRPHARRLWESVSDELAPVRVGKTERWLLAADVGALESPRGASGVRFLPPGDPYLQKPNRPLLAPDADLRKRLFRPVASPGAVLKDGGLVGLWRPKAKGKRSEITVEKVGRVSRRALAEEVERLGELRGASSVDLVLV